MVRRRVCEVSNNTTQNWFAICYVFAKVGTRGRKRIEVRVRGPA
jgi:hypothetical protein